MDDPFDKQVGGDHYRTMAIQPIEYILDNELGWCEGNIVKYITRHHQKGGRKDVEKVIHYAEMLLARYDEAELVRESVEWDQSMKLTEEDWEALVTQAFKDMSTPTDDFDPRTDQDHQGEQTDQHEDHVASDPPQLDPPLRPLAQELKPTGRTLEYPQPVLSCVDRDYQWTTLDDYDLDNDTPKSQEKESRT
jgi:hypothetical protein